MDELQETIYKVLESTGSGKLEMFGGYPAVIDGNTLPGYVIIADANENSEPSLTIYTWAALEEWMINAAETHAQDLAGADEDEEIEILREAFFEDGPEALR